MGRHTKLLQSAVLTCGVNLWAAVALADNAPTPQADAFSSPCLFKPSADLAASGQPSVAVLLSPRMPYAIHEWKRMAALAEREGFHVAVYRDPRVPDQEWREAVAGSDASDVSDAPVMDEQTAASCGLLNHTPAALVLLPPRVHPWPILGVMPDRPWLAVLRSRLMFLQSNACD